MLRSPAQSACSAVNARVSRLLLPRNCNLHQHVCLLLNARHNINIDLRMAFPRLGTCIQWQCRAGASRQAAHTSSICRLTVSADRCTDACDRQDLNLAPAQPPLAINAACGGSAAQDGGMTLSDVRSTTATGSLSRISSQWRQLCTCRPPRPTAQTPTCGAATSTPSTQAQLLASYSVLSGKQQNKCPGSHRARCGTCAL